jgi:carboxypeptidase C (cathepsin A)
MLCNYIKGWNNNLPSKQYSGFVDGDNEGILKVHYWFVECEKSPVSEAPILFWFNGGIDTLL